MKTLPLKDRLLTYIRDHAPLDSKPFSNADMARELGYSASMVSKYLNDRLEGDVAKFESVAEDVLKSAADRRVESATLFDTNVSQVMNGAFERIRRNNSVGVISGPAGVGKTCGIALYIIVNPSAVRLTVTRWNRDCKGLETILFQSIETRGWDGHSVRMDYVTSKLKGSNRLLIIDNAHRLSISALELLFDFQDETGIGIALVGNPEIIATLRKNDQQFSRCSIKAEVTLTHTAKVAQKMLVAFDPEAAANGHAADVADLADQVISQRGHMRALKHELRLAKDIRRDTDCTAPEAIKAAHTQLLRDYQLD